MSETKSSQVSKKKLSDIEIIPSIQNQELIRSILVEKENTSLASTISDLLEDQLRPQRAGTRWKMEEEEYIIYPQPELVAVIPLPGLQFKEDFDVKTATPQDKQDHISQQLLTNFEAVPIEKEIFNRTISFGGIDNFNYFLLFNKKTKRFTLDDTAENGGKDPDIQPYIIIRDSTFSIWTFSTDAIYNNNIRDQIEKLLNAESFDPDQKEPIGFMQVADRNDCMYMPDIRKEKPTIRTKGVKGVKDQTFLWKVHNPNSQNITSIELTAITSEFIRPHGYVVMDDTVIERQANEENERKFLIQLFLERKYGSDDIDWNPIDIKSWFDILQSPEKTATYNTVHEKAKLLDWSRTVSVRNMDQKNDPDAGKRPEFDIDKLKASAKEGINVLAQTFKEKEITDTLWVLDKLDELQKQEEERSQDTSEDQLRDIKKKMSALRDNEKDEDKQSKEYKFLKEWIKIRSTVMDNFDCKTPSAVSVIEETRELIQRHLEKLKAEKISLECDFQDKIAATLMTGVGAILSYYFADKIMSSASGFYSMLTGTFDGRTRDEPANIADKGKAGLLIEVGDVLTKIKKHALLTTDPFHVEITKKLSVVTGGLNNLYNMETHNYIFEEWKTAVYARAKVAELNDPEKNATADAAVKAAAEKLGISIKEATLVYTKINEQSIMDIVDSGSKKGAKEIFEAFEEAALRKMDILQRRHKTRSLQNFKDTKQWPNNWTTKFGIGSKIIYGSIREDYWYTKEDGVEPVPSRKEYNPENSVIYIGTSDSFVSLYDKKQKLVVVVPKHMIDNCIEEMKIERDSGWDPLKAKTTDYEGLTAKEIKDTLSTAANQLEKLKQIFKNQKKMAVIHQGLDPKSKWKLPPPVFSDLVPGTELILKYTFEEVEVIEPTHPLLDNQRLNIAKWLVSMCFRPQISQTTNAANKEGAIQEAMELYENLSIKVKNTLYTVLSPALSVKGFQAGNVMEIDKKEAGYSWNYFGNKEGKMDEQLKRIITGPPKATAWFVTVQKSNGERFDRLLAKDFDISKVQNSAIPMWMKQTAAGVVAVGATLALIKGGERYTGKNVSNTKKYGGAAIISLGAVSSVTVPEAENPISLYNLVGAPLSYGVSDETYCASEFEQMVKGKEKTAALKRCIAENKKETKDKKKAKDKWWTSYGTVARRNALDLDKLRVEFSKETERLEPLTVELAKTTFELRNEDGSLTQIPSIGYLRKEHSELFGMCEIIGGSCMKMGLAGILSKETQQWAQGLINAWTSYKKSIALDKEELKWSKEYFKELKAVKEESIKKSNLASCKYWYLQHRIPHIMGVRMLEFANLAISQRSNEDAIKRHKCVKTLEWVQTAVKNEEWLPEEEVASLIDLREKCKVLQNRASDAPTMSATGDIELDVDLNPVYSEATFFRKFPNVKNPKDQCTLREVYASLFSQVKNEAISEIGKPPSNWLESLTSIFNLYYYTNPMTGVVEIAFKTGIGAGIVSMMGMGGGMGGVPQTSMMPIGATPDLSGGAETWALLLRSGNMIPRALATDCVPLSFQTAMTVGIEWIWSFLPFPMRKIIWDYTVNRIKQFFGSKQSWKSPATIVAVIGILGAVGYFVIHCYDNAKTTVHEKFQIPQKEKLSQVFSGSRDEADTQLKEWILNDLAKDAPELVFQTYTESAYDEKGTDAADNVELLKKRILGNLPTLIRKNSDVEEGEAEWIMDPAGDDKVHTEQVVFNRELRNKAAIKAAKKFFDAAFGSVCDPIINFFETVSKIFKTLTDWRNIPSWIANNPLGVIKIAAAAATLSYVMYHKDSIKWGIKETYERLGKHGEGAYKKLKEVILGKNAVDMTPLKNYYENRRKFCRDISKEMQSKFAVRFSKKAQLVNHVKCIDVLDKFFISKVGILTVKQAYLEIYKNVIRMEKETPGARPNLIESLNFLFLGNPGTGKTTAVETLANLLRYTNLRPAASGDDVKYPEMIAPTINSLDALVKKDKEGITNVVSSILSIQHAMRTGHVGGILMTFRNQAKAAKLSQKWNEDVPIDLDKIIEDGALQKGMKAWDNFEENFWGEWMKVHDSEKQSNLKLTSAVELLIEEKPAAAFKNLVDGYAKTSGVIFIDEAYSLNPGVPDNKDGRKIYDLLLLAAENHRKNITFILAGYKDDIERKLISYNPGLARRFPRTIQFDDLQKEEIRKVIQDKLRRTREDQAAGKQVQGWVMSQKTEEVLVNKLYRRSKLPNFGNFAVVTQAVSDAISKAQQRYPQLVQTVECVSCKRNSRTVDLFAQKTDQSISVGAVQISAVAVNTSTKKRNFYEEGPSVLSGMFCPTCQTFQPAEMGIYIENKKVYEKEDNGERGKVLGDSIHVSQWLEIKMDDVIGENPDENKKLQDLIKKYIGKKNSIWPEAGQQASAIRISEHQFQLTTEVNVEGINVEGIKKAMQFHYKEGKDDILIGTVRKWDKKTRTITTNKPYLAIDKWSLPVDGVAPRQISLSAPNYYTGGDFVGMQNIKAELQQLIDVAKYNWRQESEGYPTVPIMLNKLFVGKPGTGKTSIAKAWGGILKELNILSDGSFIEKAGSDFVGNVVGGSQVKTNAILKSAAGKVLFIDEAYVLAESDFGLEVLNTIVEQVQAKPGADISVVMAGYEYEMTKMCREVNPGLGRRFDSDHPIIFHDYTDDELGAILDLKAENQSIEILPKAYETALEKIIRKRPRKDFGNAGTVENSLNSAIKKGMTRCLERSFVDRKMKETKVDVPDAFYIFPTDFETKARQFFEDVKIKDDELKENIYGDHPYYEAPIPLQWVKSKTSAKVKVGDEDYALVVGDIEKISDTTVQKLLQVDAAKKTNVKTVAYYVSEKLRITRLKSEFGINILFKNVISTLNTELTRVDIELRDLARKEKELKTGQENKYAPKVVADVEDHLVVVPVVVKGKLEIKVRPGHTTEERNGALFVKYYKSNGGAGSENEAKANGVLKTGVPFFPRGKDKKIKNTATWAEKLWESYKKSVADPSQEFSPQTAPNTGYRKFDDKKVEYAEKIIKVCREARKLFRARAKIKVFTQEKAELGKREKAMSKLKKQVKKYEDKFFTSDSSDNPLKCPQELRDLESLKMDFQTLESTLRIYWREKKYLKLLEEATKKAKELFETEKLTLTEEDIQKAEIYTKWEPSPLTLIKQDFDWEPDYDPIGKLRKELEGVEEICDYIQNVSDEYKAAKDIWPGDRSKWPVLSNLIFNGNSGTGKTTVANYMAEAFNKCGLLAVPNTVIKSASDLEGTVVGEAQELVQKAMEQALGGILLIDEAYELGKSEYGRQAQTKLIAMLEEEKFNKGKVVVILCGYKPDMRKMLKRNQGMASRFGKALDFEDMRDDVILRQIVKICAKSCIQIDGITVDEGSQMNTDSEAGKLLIWFMERIKSFDGWGNFRDCKTIASNIQKEVYADFWRSVHPKDDKDIEPDKKEKWKKIHREIDNYKTKYKEWELASKKWKIQWKNGWKKTESSEDNKKPKPPATLLSCNIRHIANACGTVYLDRIGPSKPNRKRLGPNYEHAKMEYDKFYNGDQNTLKKLKDKIFKDFGTADQLRTADQLIRDLEYLLDGVTGEGEVNASTPPQIYNLIPTSEGEEDGEREQATSYTMKYMESRKIGKKLLRTKVGTSLKF
jgi:AAA+ superfamily predicted ATPase